MRPTIVSISGFSSEVGKTTTLCGLLGMLSGWEAIKVTRGHYRSCGKDPQACCVSPLLGSKPLVLSGREDTFVQGKDTGRYWEAGAGRVHWVIGTDEQIEEGIRIALGRVEREGVFVEGGSFLKHIKADYSVMVASAAVNEIKSSAVGALSKMNALIINRAVPGPEAVADLDSRLLKRGANRGDLAIYFEHELESVAEDIRRLHKSRVSASVVSPGPGAAY
jgi:hypothetical protein